MIKPMNKTYFLIAVLVIASCNPVRKADKLAAKNQLVTLYPEVKFDSELAKTQLGAGSSVIKGVLYKSTNKMSVVGAKAYGQRIKVYLFPVHDYFNVWYDLRDKKEGKLTHVYMSEEAYAYRREAVTDDYGRFEFPAMKPGRYFLQAFMSTYKTGYEDVNVGTNSYGTQYYQKRAYTIEKQHRVEKFVEVKRDGEVVEVKLN